MQIGTLRVYTNTSIPMLSTKINFNYIRNYTYNYADHDTPDGLFAECRSLWWNEAYWPEIEFHPCQNYSKTRKKKAKLEKALKAPLGGITAA